MHHTYNSFDLLMRGAPLLCVTAFLFFLFGIGLASFVFTNYAERYHMSNFSLIHKWCYWGYHGFSTLCSKATQVTNISSQPKG